MAFRKITRVKPAADAKVLATASGGHPLLLEKAVGRGIVLLFASAADRDWGDWPQSRLYVPLVHQIVGYLTDRLPENQRVRAEIAGPGADKPPGVASENNMLLVRNVDAAGIADRALFAEAIPRGVSTGRREGRRGCRGRRSRRCCPPASNARTNFGPG